MLVPGSAIISMFIGAVISEIWKKINAANAERHMVPVASGFIAGEAIIAVLIPILVTLHIVSLK